MKAQATLILLGMMLAGCLSEEDSETADEESAPSGNNAPVISGSPASAIVINDQYSFEPNASDPDGDDLTFNINNRPNWASFDTATGALSGRPTLGDIGRYENIRISASDGDQDAQLDAFTIVVSQGGDGSVTLTWTAPTENEDGSTLVDLAGYRIYYGTSSGSYDHEINIDNPGLTTYVVENLVPDTYFFVATAFNESDIESGFSGEAVRVVE